jgi:hypothetical protein
MKNVTICLSVLVLLAACTGGGGSPVDSGGAPAPRGRGGLSDWQSSLLGQEGHGGDAVVCFDIPVERALYKVTVGEPEENCTADGSCSSSRPHNPGTDGGSGLVWRMTDEGRKAIRSAKPLEQYLAERIASKKNLIDHLNQVSTEEGYQEILRPFAKLPAAFSRVSEMHQRLGWLHEDGIASDFGLLDVNDSGFIAENEIDKTHCKELQAVVRRDHQLWYDSDIVKHFDNAGRVLIQLHEEIYAWGKQQDEINRGLFGPPAHETSTKTRRLILKILDESIDQKLVNENLKDLGFSTMYWENQFKVPTSVGHYMDTESCIAEQQFLKDFFKNGTLDRDFWLQTELLFSDRYLKASHSSPATELRNNFPNALSNMIALTMGGGGRTFESEIRKLQAVFERPESCIGEFAP